MSEYSESYVVICPDGWVRHKAFDSYGAAYEWGVWGHCCLAGHLVQVVPHNVTLALPTWR